MPEPNSAAAAPRPRLTLEQKIARQKAQLDKLKAQRASQSRKLATREKIIIGSAIAAAVKDNPELRKLVVETLHSQVTRDVDREVIAPWLSLT